MKFVVSLTIVLTAVLLLCKTSFGKPLERRPRAIEQPNSYDLGPVDVCATPTLTVCGDYIDYQVPGVLAEPRLVAIKEATILAAYEVTEKEIQVGYNSTLCAQAFLQLECRNQFPRCEQDSHGVRSVSFTDRDCSSLMSQCSPSLANKFAAEGYCSLNSTVPLGQCKRTTEYSGYQFCNAVEGWSDWYITDWMHLYLQRIEEQISEFKVSAYGTSDECVRRFVRFSCQSVGRCWDQGRRAELIPSQKDCNNVVNCYSSYLRGPLENTMQCHRWPLEADKPTSVATVITTQPTMQAGTSTASTVPSQTRPGHRVTFPTAPQISSAPSTLHHSLIAQLYIMVVLTAVLLCVQIT